jgi:hypothetical protein
MAFSRSSAAFEAGGPIPRRFTCDGDNVPPPLMWSGASLALRTFVLLVDDPDAPDRLATRMTSVQWVLCNLPSDSAGLLQ